MEFMESMEFDGFHEFAWNYMEFYGLHKFAWNPWKSMESMASFFSGETLKKIVSRDRWSNYILEPLFLIRSFLGGTF